MSFPAPTRQSIEDGTVREGQHYDYKEQLNLDSEQGKSKFIDDVGAFLNASGGHIIVGVKEKGGTCEALRPLIGDSHGWAERIRSLVTQHIDPVPNGVATHAIEVGEGGFLLDIRVPEHRMQPYQNRLTGGFYLRTDRQNRPILRDEIQSYFKRLSDYRVDLHRLAADERARLATRNVMVEDGPVLDLAILPREHYDAHPPFSYRRGGAIQPGPGFPHHGHGMANVWFRACQGGSEAVETTFSDKLISRLFISSNWFVHATVVHPFAPDGGEGRVTIRDMELKLRAYLDAVAVLLGDGGVRGPFAVAFRFSHLHRSSKVAWVFDFDGPVEFEPRELVETLQPEGLARAATEVVLVASRYR